MVDAKIKSYVGLAQRANAVLYGEDIIMEKVRLAKVVLISASASQKYQDRLKCRLTTCPVFILDDLQECLHRDKVNAIAITNENLAKQNIALMR